MAFKNPFGAGGLVHQFWLRIGAIRRQFALDRCVGRLMQQGDGPRAPDIANRLYDLWGDPLDQARESYLRSCIMEYKESKGSVLMGGASLSTLILGAVGAASEDGGRKVFCFEQDNHWSAVIRSWLDQYRIPNVYVINAAPAMTPKTVRFSVDTKRLPKDFGLILCEGGRASPKSTISMLQSFGTQLAPMFTILARKVKIEEDGPFLKKWASENNATFVVINKQDGFVKIACRGVKKPGPAPTAVVESIGRKRG